MKKMLVLLTVMVAVFGFSTGAFAAFGDPICTTCKGCTLDRVYCEIPGEQEYDNCRYFDYDHRFYGDGYCNDTDVSKCKAIFNICNCEDQTDFVAGQTSGVRATILVNGAPGENGAYYSAPTSPTHSLMFGMYASEADACAAGSQTRTFGPGQFFKYGCLPPAITTLIGNPTCIVPAASQATVYLTNITAGYMITLADELAKLSHWWIDLLPVRIDPYVLHNNEVISILLELLNQESGGICADCTAVCECIIDIAIVCCEGAPDIPLPDQFGMYFPYVTWVQPWNTGIVITNISSILPVEFGMNVDPADMEVTIILHDVNGDTFVLFKDDFTGTSWAFSLTNQLPNFSGVPAPGPAWLEIRTNFVTDGHLYMVNGSDGFGLGTLPRLWSTAIEIYKQYAALFGFDPTAFAPAK